jgi:hypothetical protein
MSDQSLEPAGSDYGLVSHIASRTTPLHSVALRVMNILSNRLLLKPIIPIDNPHRGSGDLLGFGTLNSSQIQGSANLV